MIEDYYSSNNNDLNCWNTKYIFRKSVLRNSNESMFIDDYIDVLESIFIGLKSIDL